MEKQPPVFCSTPANGGAGLRTVLPLLDQHPHAAALDNALARVLCVIAVRVGACQLSLVRCTIHLQTDKGSALSIWDKHSDTQMRPSRTQKGRTGAPQASQKGTQRVGPRSIP